MKLILENEDFTTETFEVNEANCYIKELKNCSGLVEESSKFKSAIWIFKSLYSNAKAILYDTNHKSLHARLKDDLQIPILEPNSKEKIFLHVSYDFMLFTSGTTGLPAGVFKTKSDIFSEVDILRKIIDKHDIKKMVATIPFIHIYGLLMLELARKIDVDLYLRERFLPHDLANLITKGTMVATTPVYINALLQGVGDYDFSSSLFISSTSPLSHENAQKFCDRFNTNLIQLYGSTESGGIAYRLNGENLWRPMQKVNCSLNAENCLHVSSPWVSENKYEGKVINLNKSIDTFDEVEFIEDKFKVVGRKGFIIKLGGKRYSCLQIENVIEKYDGVESSLVELCSNSEKNLLKDERLIVYVEGKKPNMQELKKLIKSEFGIVNFPMKIVMVEKIPKSPIGKKLRDIKNLKCIN